MKLDILAYRAEHLEKILGAGFLPEMKGVLSRQVPLNQIKAGAHYDPLLVTPLIPINEELKERVQHAFGVFGLPVLFCKI
jgi:hypothetical protein